MLEQILTQSVDLFPKLCHFPSCFVVSGTTLLSDAGRSDSGTRAYAFDNGIGEAVRVRL